MKKPSRVDAELVSGEYAISLYLLGSRGRVLSGFDWKQIPKNKTGPLKPVSRGQTKMLKGERNQKREIRHRQKEREN